MLALLVRNFADTPVSSKARATGRVASACCAVVVTNLKRKGHTINQSPAAAASGRMPRR